MRILIVQLGRFGDLILISPVFRLIKEKYKDAEITLFAGRKNYDALVGNPYINKIIKLDKSLKGILSTIYSIRKKRYDYWIDPRDHFSKESRIIAQLSRAHHKIGFNQPQLKKVFDIDLEPSPKNLHHTEIAINSLRVLGINLCDTVPKPELYFESGEVFGQTVNDIILGEPYILVNISASGAHKMWDSIKWFNFLATANISQKRIVLNFMESERQLAQKIISEFPHIELHNAKRIRDVMLLVSKSELVVTPDTSIVHIASAFNKPLFAFYSGLDNFYDKFRPTTEKFVAVRANHDDKGIGSIDALVAGKEFNAFCDMLCLSK